MRVPPQEIAAVLRVLAERLSDAAILDCLPEREAAAVRGALQAAADMAAAYMAAAGERCGTAGTQPDTTVGSAVRAGLRLSKVSLFTDGAARGNPGEAGAGILLLDEQGREVAARGIFLGQCTNNVAEYRALVLGLQEARRQGAREISIYLDAELVVRQLLGSYQVKDPKLKQLHAEVLALLNGFDFHQIAHVPRQENQRADQLANLAIDRRVK